MTGCEPMNIENFRPNGPRVVVEREDTETVSPGGIIIPDTAQRKAVIGVIRAIGTGYPRKDGRVDAIDLRVGSRVLMAEWGGIDMPYDDHDYMVVRVDDLAGVFNDEEDE